MRGHIFGLQSAGFSPLPDAEPAAVSPSDRLAPSPKPAFSSQDLRLMQRVLGLEEHENGAASYGPAPSSGSAPPASLDASPSLGYNGDKIAAGTLTNAQRNRLISLDNTIRDHLTAEDFSGTLRDLPNNPVPNGRGGYFDHLGEMKDSYKSLQKIKKALEGSLKNPNLSGADRILLQQGLDKANLYIGKIDELFKPYGGIQ